MRHWSLDPCDKSWVQGGSAAQTLSLPGRPSHWSASAGAVPSLVYLLRLRRKKHRAHREAADTEWSPRAYFSQGDSKGIVLAAV